VLGTRKNLKLGTGYKEFKKRVFSIQKPEGKWSAGVLEYWKKIIKNRY